MDRRDFLKRGLMTLSGAALTSLAGPFVPDTLARPAAQGFTLCIVTDRPEHSITLVDRFLKSFSVGQQRIAFETAPLAGHHMGDVVFFRGSRLVNYRESGGALSTALTRLAEAQGFPRRLDHPVLLKYHAGGARQATEAHIFQGEVLIDRLPLGIDRRAYRVEGSAGQITLSIKNRQVQIVEATCKHKTCMTMGPIQKPGESLVCIPARISVSLDGTSLQHIDGITH